MGSSRFWSILVGYFIYAWRAATRAFWRANVTSRLVSGAVHRSVTAGETGGASGGSLERAVVGPKGRFPSAGKKLYASLSASSWKLMPSATFIVRWGFSCVVGVSSDRRSRQALDWFLVLTREDQTPCQDSVTSVMVASVGGVQAVVLSPELRLVCPQSSALHLSPLGPELEEPEVWDWVPWRNFASDGGGCCASGDMGKHIPVEWRAAEEVTKLVPMDDLAQATVHPLPRLRGESDGIVI